MYRVETNRENCHGARLWTIGQLELTLEAARWPWTCAARCLPHGPLPTCLQPAATPIKKFLPDGRYKASLCTARKLFLKGFQQDGFDRHFKSYESIALTQERFVNEIKVAFVRQRRSFRSTE